MLKKLILTTLMITVLLTVFFAFTALTAEETWPLSVRVNDEEVVFPDAQPFVDENYRTQVPVRFVSEALESEVSWLAETSQVSIKKDDKHILLTIGKMEMSINGEIKTLDSAPLLKDSRTFVPIRFVSEALGATIDWEQATNTVYIDTAIKADVNVGTGKIEASSTNINDFEIKIDSGDNAGKFAGKTQVQKESLLVVSEEQEGKGINFTIKRGGEADFNAEVQDVKEILSGKISDEVIAKLVGLLNKYKNENNEFYAETLKDAAYEVVFTAPERGSLWVDVYAI